MAAIRERNPRQQNDFPGTERHNQTLGHCPEADTDEGASGDCDDAPQTAICPADACRDKPTD